MSRIHLGRLALAVALLWGMCAPWAGSALAAGPDAAARPSDAGESVQTPVARESVPASVPDEAAQAAQRILADRARRYPSGWLEGMGFASEQEALEATVEDPVPVYVLNAEAVAKGIETFADALHDVSRVTFVVSSGGRPVTRLTLGYDGAGYHFGELGGRGEDLHRGLSVLPTRSGARLVRFGPLEFLYLRHGGTEYLVYLDRMPIPGIESARLYTYGQIRPDLQKFVAQCLRNVRPDAMGFCPPAPEPLHPAVVAVAAAGALGLLGACIHTFCRIARM